ncbi:PREDICTED: nuclear pore complex protein DDB_G0274915-like isoform X2 [Nicrophorus vespilloides]|uniref:Nuclear pore complex protein DDB_G0274915-like isoform X2 n=1 Tax=Nicrophorus vespilloides TaxID=110193 RepID=A0ABM1MQ99_NICVS|nr:PREDICTED: nuclear pore complex protein DDB_G0274915-like isoform X2 [Nicrophorus vespilloides]
MQNSQFPETPPIFSPINGKSKRSVNTFVTPKKDVSFLSSTRHSITKSSPRYSLSQTVTPKFQNDNTKRNGPLLASTQFNVNLGTYTDVKSPGLATRIVQYNNEQTPELPAPTHQSKYGSPGLFPVVHFFKKGLPVITPKQSKVTMKIATPDSFYYNGNSSILYDESYSSPKPEESDINTKSVLDALKEISRKRIHVTDEFDVESESLKRSKRQEYNLNEYSKRNREDSPTHSEVTSPSSMQSTKRMCIVDPVYASSTSYQMFVEKGTKRKSKETEDIILENNQKQIKLSNAETQTLPLVDNTKEKLQHEENILEDKSKKADLDKERTLKDKDETDISVVLQVFDEAPLEIHKKNKLATILGAITGEKPQLISFDNEENGADKDEELVSILSPKNKSKHDKHVHFGANSTALFAATDDDSSKSKEDSEVKINNFTMPLSGTKIDTSNNSTATISNLGSTSNTSKLLTSSVTSTSGGGGFKFDLTSKPNISENSVLKVIGSEVPKLSFMSSSNGTGTSVRNSAIESLNSTKTDSAEPLNVATLNTTTTVSKSDTIVKPLFGSSETASSTDEKNKFTVFNAVTQAPKLGTKSTTNINSPATTKASMFNATQSSNVTKGGFSFGTSPNSLQASSANPFVNSSTAPTTFVTSTGNTSTSIVPSIGFDTFGKQGTNITFGAATTTPTFGTGSILGSTSVSTFGAQNIVTTAQKTAATFAVPSTTFGSTGPFGKSNASGTFGQPTNSFATNPVSSFGTTSTTGFGVSTTTPTVAGFGITTTTPSVAGFGVTTTKPAVGFGVTTTTPAVGFGVTTTTPAVAFGVTTTTPAVGFGVTTSTPTIGFGVTTAVSTVGFGVPTMTPTAAFAVPTSTPTFGSSVNTNFGAVTVATTFGSTIPSFLSPTGSSAGFGNTSTITQSGFGVNTSTTSTFGAPVSSASVFGFGGKTTAAATTSTFSFGATTTTPSFGTNSTNTFGATKPAFGNSFGTNSGFSNPSTTQSATFAFGDKKTFGAPTPATTASTFGGSQNTAAPPMFAFGGGNNSANNNANTFGKPSSAVASGNTFNFNASKNAVPASGFTNNSTSFGNPTTTQSSFGTASTSSFGNATAAFGATTTTGGFTAPKTTVNTFGSTNTPTFGTTNATPAFGTAPPSFPAANSTFGSSAAPAFGSGNGFGSNNFNASTGFGGSGDAAKPQTSAFNNNSTTNFAFGANNNAPAASQTNAFAFGVAAPPKAGVFSFGNTEAPKPGSFNFSAGSATTSFGNNAAPNFGSPTPNFQGFNGGAPQYNAPSPGGAMFSIGSGSSTKQRTQLKAKRRT